MTDSAKEKQGASCKDCEEAAKHAASDATTPGFFHDKCAKHRTTDSNHERAALSARGLAEMRPNRIREAAYILADQFVQKGWLEKKPCEYSVPDMICDAMYAVVSELLASRNAVIEQRARLVGETEALKVADKITEQVGLQYLESGSKGGWSACDDAGHSIRDAISPEGRSLVEKREAEIRLEEHDKSCEHCAAILKHPDRVMPPFCDYRLGLLAACRKAVIPARTVKESNEK